ncbi:EAL domain-containing protein [uncultured Roseovarius sp.]|uniref:EAL domain-containing protein n=1 Tax=uncultured Roseovarius sp. TaxID=293344 RepID=UPI00262339AF|nr:EAL domain-containing protein [uncultured Roseovarius sp.]
MGQKKKWADIPAGLDSPLSYAVSARDRTAIDMVKRAVRHKQVMLAYQAIVPARQQDRAAFYEGLIRVMDPTGRVIPASEFINEIEVTETGRIIDCLALEKGLHTLTNCPDLRLALNMSARSIGYPRWMRVLKRGLGEDPTVAERLILEITERSAMLVPELVTGFMKDLQHKGVSFALDDFGAGFTSFRLLKDFYFDILKIDGQFIRGIATDPDNQVLAAALASIGRQFDMVTVAESVEKPQDAEYLTALGIDCLQGYYFGAPTVHPPWLDVSLDQTSA